MLAVQIRVHRTFICFSNEDWFHLSRHISQNNSYWSAKNSMRIYTVPLHDDTVGVWCTPSATTVIVPFIYLRP